jgi:hypothetical protein
MPIAAYRPESHAETIKLLNAAAPNMAADEQGLGDVLNTLASVLTDGGAKKDLNKIAVTDAGKLAVLAKAVIENITMTNGMLGTYGSMGESSTLKHTDLDATIEGVTQDIASIQNCVREMAKHPKFGSSLQENPLLLLATLRHITQQIANKSYRDSPTISPELISLGVTHQADIGLLSDMVQKLPPGDHTKDVVEALMGAQANLRGIAPKVVPGRTPAIPAASAAEAKEGELSPLAKAVQFMIYQKTWASAMVGALEHPKGAELLDTMNKASAALQSKAKGATPPPPP